MTRAVQEVTLDDHLWATFSALLDGPATARALADRLGSPVATVTHHLARLSAKGVVVVDGSRRVGGWLERRYRLPEGAVTVRDPLALPLALQEVQRGIRRAEVMRLPAVAGLVAVRVLPEDARAILDRTKDLRHSTELQNRPGEGVKMGLFVAGWLEEPCTQ